MSKQKKSDAQPKTLPELIKPGEFFVLETYLRLHRTRHELTTEEATEKLNRELAAGTVTRHHKRGEIQVYRKV